MNVEFRELNTSHTPKGDSSKSTVCHIPTMCLFTTNQHPSPFQVQDGLFGTPYGLYTGSSAFETELGVQPPVGFWDPLGFTKTEDAASFRRRRYVELKHGRVAMFACLGYIVTRLKEIGLVFGLVLVFFLAWLVDVVDRNCSRVS